MQKSILSIDPGFARLGYCLSNKAPIKYGCLETSNKKLFEQRLFNIYTFLEEIVKSNKVELIIYEAPIGLRGDNGYKLAQVVGVINLLAVKYATRLIAYSSSQIKKAVTGNSKADKKSVEDYVKKAYNVEDKLLDDTYDAIAILLTYQTILDS